MLGVILCTKMLSFVKQNWQNENSLVACVVVPIKSTFNLVPVVTQRVLPTGKIKFASLDKYLAVASFRLRCLALHVVALFWMHSVVVIALAWLPPRGVL